MTEGKPDAGYKPTPAGERCPLCGGSTAAGYLVTSGDHHATAFHGAQKSLGFSERQCRVSARICTSCGFILLFGTTPQLFWVETEEGRQQAQSTEVTPTASPKGRGDEVAPAGHDARREE